MSRYSSSCIFISIFALFGSITAPDAGKQNESLPISDWPDMGGTRKESSFDGNNLESPLLSGTVPTSGGSSGGGGSWSLSGGVTLSDVTKKVSSAGMKIGKGLVKSASRVSTTTAYNYVEFRLKNCTSSDSYL